MAQKQSRKKNPQATMALSEHFREFRIRLLKAAIATVICAVAGFFLYEPFMTAISAPVAALNTEEGRTAALNYSTAISPFDQMIRISLYIGLVIASPVWIYQLWAFITPALYKREKLYTLGFTFTAIPMFLLGTALAWLLLPSAVQTLTQFSPNGATNFLTADVYISFVVKFMLAFGLAFILPVILVGLNFIGLIRGKTLLKSWRWVVVLVAILAAMAAPGGEIMSMVYLMVPLLFFFFLAIGIAILNDKRRDRRNAKLAEGLTDDEINRPTSLEELNQLGRKDQQTT
ncbi:twin arginine-targeting protein translocase TatC [Rothia nasimurium]|uniref:Sec-independent protein translocase protein TatC n=1 Tax=Rothia nasimurium TaxID=85336 RepID=A0A1Y1RRG8_9MICC|nr:twin-arginine translocase subunit TatC [Rothia nasimurium]ORC21981.1 twin arginine-targeting protein translocase TatC [Rothia nasimurium]